MCWCLCSFKGWVRTKNSPTASRPFLEKSSRARTRSRTIGRNDEPSTAPRSPCLACSAHRSVYITLLTSMFMHGGLAHIFGNMLFLWIFGDNVEDSLGHRALPRCFTSSTGIIASLAHVFTTVACTEPERTALVPSLGAFGCNIGRIGCVHIFVSRATCDRHHVSVLTQVPSYVAIGMWFVFQLISGLGMFGGGSQAGGVAYAAHVGGFVAGLVLIKPFAVGAHRSATQLTKEISYESICSASQIRGRAC